MGFDGLFMHAVVRELSEKIVGDRVDKIYQTDAGEVVLRLRGRETKTLLLCGAADHARVHLTERGIETPLAPPAFAMLLRKHLEGGKVTGVFQHGLDRIMDVVFSSRSELRDEVEVRLVLECMGKHSNLFLLDEAKKVLGSLRHVTAAMTSFAVRSPGTLYERPSHNDQLDPRNAESLSLFQEALSGAEQSENGLIEAARPLSVCLYKTFAGLSPRAAEEVLKRAGLRSDVLAAQLVEGEWERLFEAFRSFIHQADEAKGPTVLYKTKEGKLLDFTLFPYESMAGEKVFFDSPSKLLDAYNEKTADKDVLKQRAVSMRRVIMNNLDRARKKEQLQEKQLEDTKEREIQKRRADLIMAHLYEIEPGASSWETEDFYEADSPRVTISLDPNRTASENAQKLYARYQKLRRTEEAVSKQLLHTREEAEYLESMLGFLDLASCERDLSDIREELSARGYLRRQSREKKKNLKASEPLRFMTSEGVAGLIGRTNTQNDTLTFQIAKPEDEWFHIKKMPGSHVILQVSQLEMGRDYTEKSLEEAAKKAAYYSKGRMERAAAVDHTKKKYVKKPSGSAPGFVTYTHEQTLFVDAAEGEEHES